MIIEKSDSLIDQIYFLLWLKEQGLKDSFGVRIPDTILFRGKELLNWYFVGKEEKILMRTKAKLTKQNVYEQFANVNKSKCEVVATLIFPVTVAEMKKMRNDEILRNQQIILDDDEPDQNAIQKKDFISPYCQAEIEQNSSKPQSRNSNIGSVGNQTPIKNASSVDKLLQTYQTNDLNEKQKKRQRIAAARKKHQETDDTRSENLSIKYLTRKDLHQFLFETSQEKLPQTCVLQQFVQPYGDYQTLIQVVWSPNLCVFSQRMNFKCLDDQNFDIYQRMMTFDGAEMYSRTVPLRGQQISQEIRSQAEQIVERISHVSYQKIMIKRMVMFFKPDKNNQVFFLFSSSIRLEGEQVQRESSSLPGAFSPILSGNNQQFCNQPLVIQSNFVPPKQLQRIMTTNTMRPEQLIKDIECFSCGNLVQQKDLVPVRYSFIVQYFTQFVPTSQISEVQIREVPDQSQHPTLNYLGQNIKSIPPIFSKIYPKMNFDTYQVISQQQNFLSQFIELCFDCYIQFSSKNKLSGVKLSIGPQQSLAAIISQKRSRFDKQAQLIALQQNAEMEEVKVPKGGRRFVSNKEIYNQLIGQLKRDIQMSQLEKSRHKPASNYLFTNLNYSQKSSSSTNEFASTAYQSNSNFSKTNYHDNTNSQFEIEITVPQTKGQRKSNIDFGFKTEARQITELKQQLMKVFNNKHNIVDNSSQRPQSVFSQTIEQNAPHSIVIQEGQSLEEQNIHDSKTIGVGNSTIGSATTLNQKRPTSQKTVGQKERVVQIDELDFLDIDEGTEEKSLSKAKSFSNLRRPLTSTTSSYSTFDPHQSYKEIQSMFLKSKNKNNNHNNNQSAKTNSTSTKFISSNPSSNLYYQKDLEVKIDSGSSAYNNQSSHDTRNEFATSQNQKSNKDFNSCYTPSQFFPNTADSQGNTGFSYAFLSKSISSKNFNYNSKESFSSINQNIYNNNLNNNENNFSNINIQDDQKELNVGEKNIPQFDDYENIAIEPQEDEYN